MLSLLFAICIMVCWKFIFGLRASWGIMNYFVQLFSSPVILIGMVIGGLMYIAFPLLIIGGIYSIGDITFIIDQEEKTESIVNQLQRM